MTDPGRRAPDHEQAVTGSRVPSAERRAVFALTALVVAQPIFERIANAPEFLSANGVRGGGALLFTLLVFVGPPLSLLLCAEIAGRFSGRLRRIVLRVGLVLGGGAMALLVLRRTAPDLGTAGAFGIAALVGIAGTAVHAKSRAVRELGNLLALLVLAVPLLFLIRIGGIAGAGSEASGIEHLPRAGPPPPVVLVLWDELPISTLLDEEGSIDGRWFPAFARVAATSTRYSEATTTGAMTNVALAALLTGRIRDPHDQQATFATLFEDRRTIFELVASTHERVGYSSVPGVVRRGVEILDGSAFDRWARLADDVGILYLHLVLPAGLRRDLPAVGAAWGGFRDRESEGVVLQRAISALRAPSRRPLFAYFHSALPHHPWRYLPSGARYPTGPQLVADGFSGVSGVGRWTRRPWPVIQAFQRHVLQTMFADRLLGRLVERLTEIGVWDEALVIVTADHGAAFEPGLPLRIPTDATRAEIGAVPLFVKLPHQVRPTVDDRPASLVDLLPTIAESLGVQVSWPLDGLSLLGPDPGSDRERRIAHPEAPSVRIGDGLADEIRRLARRRRSYFASVDGAGRDPFRIGPYSELVGRPLAGLTVGTSREPWTVERLGDGDAGAARSARPVFTLVGGARPAEALAIALAADDTVVATTAWFPGGDGAFSVILPEPLEVDRLRLFRVRAGGPGGPRLEELSWGSAEFSLENDGATVRGPAGERWTIVDGSFDGAVHPVVLESESGVPRFLAWASDGAGRAPERLVAFAGDRLVAAALPGAPEGDFFEYVRFVVPESQVFYLVPGPTGDATLRFVALGADGRAGEIPLATPPGDPHR